MNLQFLPDNRAIIAAQNDQDQREKMNAYSGKDPICEGHRVRKIGGSFQHTGTVVAEFVTTAGQPRIVLEFDAPVSGMLHVYRPDQVEIIDS